MLVVLISHHVACRLDWEQSIIIVIIPIKMLDQFYLGKGHSEEQNDHMTILGSSQQHLCWSVGCLSIFHMEIGLQV